MAEVLQTGLKTLEMMPLFGRIPVRKILERQRKIGIVDRLNSTDGIALATSEVADLRTAEDLVRDGGDHANWSQARIPRRDRVASALVSRISPAAEIVVVQGIISKTDDQRRLEEGENPVAVTGAERLAAAVEDRMSLQRAKIGTAPQVARMHPVVVDETQPGIDHGVLAKLDDVTQRVAMTRDVPLDAIYAVGVINNHFAERRFDRLQANHLSTGLSGQGVVFLDHRQPNPMETQWSDVPRQLTA